MDEWYKQLPPVTRVYVSLCFVTTAACALELITPFHIYFNTYFIFRKLELWRLLTNFLYFGSLNLDFVFHMFFLVKYCKTLEEGSFRGRSDEFLWMLLFGATLLNVAAAFVDLRFLGLSLTFMMVYVWGRRNAHVTLSFLGLFNFTAPYLPWVLLAFSVVLRSSPVVDLLGMAVGHLYYFLEDVYPRISGRRWLKTPRVLGLLFGRQEADIIPPMEAHPPLVPAGEVLPQGWVRFPAPGVVPPPQGFNQGQAEGLRQPHEEEVA